MGCLFPFIVVLVAARCADGAFTVSSQRVSLLSPNKGRPEWQSRRRRPVLEESRQQSDSITSSDTSILVPLAALAACGGLSLAALFDYLPGSIIDASSSNLMPFFATLPFGVVFSGSCDPYTPAQVIRDASTAIVTLTAASAFVKLCTDSVKTGRTAPRDARKIIHTLSAPLFMFCWPLFSDALGARAFASVVPFLMAVRLVVAGSSSSESADSSSEVELAEAVSRSGDAKEALGGPFIYVLVLLFSTLVFWRDNPVGVVSVATMACGDGLADLLGRRFGASNKWSFNQSKSVAGSAALVAGSVAGSYGLIAWLTKTGAMMSLGLSSGALLLRLLAIATVCAFVELIPVGDDNVSVPVSAALLSLILLPH